MNYCTSLHVRIGNSLKVLISSINRFINRSLSLNPTRMYNPEGWRAILKASSGNSLYSSRLLKTVNHHSISLPFNNITWIILQYHRKSFSTWSQNLFNGLTRFHSSIFLRIYRMNMWQSEVSWCKHPTPAPGHCGKTGPMSQSKSGLHHSTAD